MTRRPRAYARKNCLVRSIRSVPVFVDDDFLKYAATLDEVYPARHYVRKPKVRGTILKRIKSAIFAVDFPDKVKEGPDTRLDLLTEYKGKPRSKIMEEVMIKHYETVKLTGVNLKVVKRPSTKPRENKWDSNTVKLGSRTIQHSHLVPSSRIKRRRGRQRGWGTQFDELSRYDNRMTLAKSILHSVLGYVGMKPFGYLVRMLWADQKHSDISDIFTLLRHYSWFGVTELEDLPGRIFLRDYVVNTFREPIKAEEAFEEVFDNFSVPKNVKGTQHKNHVV